MTDIPDDIPVLASPSDAMVETPLVEESLQLEPADAPTVEKISKTNLSRMKNEDLIVHAHKLDPNIDLPDGAKKSVLVEEILKLQGAAE